MLKCTLKREQLKLIRTNVQHKKKRTIFCPLENVRNGTTQQICMQSEKEFLNFLHPVSSFKIALVKTLEMVLSKVFYHEFLSIGLFPSEQAARERGQYFVFAPVILSTQSLHVYDNSCACCGV